MTEEEKQLVNSAADDVRSIFNIACGVIEGHNCRALGLGMIGAIMSEMAKRDGHVDFDSRKQAGLKLAEEIRDKVQAITPEFARNANRVMGVADEKLH